MEIKREITVTIADMANAFAHATSEDQAKFLNLVAAVSEEYPKDRVYQWSWISTQKDRHGSLLLGEDARQMVREWNEYFS